jgi:hypothetical protein
MTTKTKTRGALALRLEEGYAASVDKPVIRIVISVPESLRDEAAKLAKEEDRSLAALIRIALRAYLDARKV